MKIPTKKLESGFEIPVYGLGLWQVGGRWEADTSHDAEEVEAIQFAIEQGITHIDTAESYSDGHAEELLGTAIKGIDRESLFIATKVSAWNQGFDGVMRACESSLKRIGTDYIDLYMIHRFPEPGISIEETMRAFDELVDQGIVKHVGVSNLTPNRFREAQKHTKNKIVANQVHYNLQYREVEEKGVVQHCQDNDVMLVAWRPLQKNTLPDSAIVQGLAKKYEKTPAQIAINWLVSQKNVVTLSKTSNPDHLRENLGALGWSLEVDDIEKIRKEFPGQILKSDAVPLDYAADTAP